MLFGGYGAFNFCYDLTEFGVRKYKYKIYVGSITTDYKKKH